MNLLYKTRGMTPPRGKPWVYLCAHPSELAVYAERVAAELLAKQDCAVWYAEDPTAERDEAFFAALSEMQLVVMPVTRRLLTEHSPAIAEEFAFAVKRHIPVLPLMQENGLDELFDSVCGALQYLDPHKTDDTAIGYDEKLDAYLRSVFIGDELAAKIRAAFDAYVFLSYRKKDRAHAQELMRLIHRNEFCRDIAIWYDEFLTPGENWSKAIGEALEKSDLFVMAVTPNLVNEQNYVMTKEYPLAKQHAKPILPAELVPTDRALLAEKYEGLPSCTDAHDAPSLAAALTNAFSTLALRENDRSPEHRFFIGLAYLGGVDVEVNHDLAVRLITEAAEEGVAEAAEKLVSMYRTGHGVARSYSDMLRWQERAVTLRQAAFEAQDTPDNLNDLFWCVLTLGDYQRECGLRDAAEATYRRAEAALTDSPLGAFTFFLRHHALVNNRLGNALRDAGDMQGALACYTQYYNYSQRLTLRHERHDDLRNCMVSCNKLGDIYKDEGQFDMARQYYEQGLDLARRLVDDAASAEARRDLSISYERLGDICFSMEQYEEAKAYFEQEYAISAALAEELGTPDAERDLAVCCYRLGRLVVGFGDAEGGKRYFLQDLDISRSLNERFDSVSTRRDLAVSHFNVADFYAQTGQPREAFFHFENAQKLNRALVAQTGLPEDRRNLYVSLYRCGRLCSAVNLTEQAYALHAEAVDVCRVLSKQWRVVQTMHEHCEAIASLISVCTRLGRDGEIQALCEEAVPMMREVAEKTEETKAWYNLSFHDGLLGDIYAAAGQAERAKPLYEEHLFITGKIAEVTGRPDDYDDLAIAYYRVATVDDARKRECLREAIAIYERLLAQFPDNAKYRGNLEELKTM